MKSSSRGRPRRLRAVVLASVAGLLASSAMASETISYSYDALGRLVQVARSGAVNNGVSESYSYDPANNRTNVTVSGVPAPPSFSINDVAVTEGGNLVFTVTKTGTTNTSFSVNYAIAAGTAASGSDFDYSAQAQTGTLTFASNVTTQTVTVHTIDDAATETAETMFVNLSGATGGATISDSQGVGTINDNDAPPPCNGVSFTVASNGAVTEGATSAFTVTKTGSATGSCSVNYATTDGTAIAPGDYTTASNTLTFTSVQTSQTVSVTTINDTAVESAETFGMSLSSPTGGATLGTPSSAAATINDNDGNIPPTPVNDTGSQGKCTVRVYNVTPNDTDPDGDYPLAVTAVTGSGGVFTVYSPTQVQFESFSGTGNKVGTYTVRDNRGATANATLTVNVSGGTCALAPGGSL